MKFLFYWVVDATEIPILHIYIIGMVILQLRQIPPSCLFIPVSSDLLDTDYIVSSHINKQLLVDDTGMRWHIPQPPV